jgi:hypothetical protein
MCESRTGIIHNCIEAVAHAKKNAGSVEEARKALTAVRSAD